VYTPRWPAQDWEDRADYFLLHGPSAHHFFGLALRLRLGAEVSKHVRDVRAWFAERDRRRFTWVVSDSATPSDLRERLLSLGAQPDAEEPLLAGMLLGEAPPAVESLEVRPVETFDEFCAARELSWANIGAMSEEERGQSRARLRQAWADYPQVDIVVYAVFVEGRPVASGGAAFSDEGVVLAGASTHPDFRGRGCYRALVRVRWDAAVARGTPLLATQAGKMSRPILERLGFQQIATVHALVDEVPADRPQPSAAAGGARRLPPRSSPSREHGGGRAAT
jgi:GNAT superfamily N-acetyltransferase